MGNLVSSLKKAEELVQSGTGIRPDLIKGLLIQLRIPGEMGFACR